VFLAGAKLLDSVRPAAPALALGSHPPPLRRRAVTGRNRPRRLPMSRGSVSPISRRTD
jgi:hypothetical protein